MDHEIRAPHGSLERRQVEDIPPMELEAGRRRGLLQEMLPPGRKVVVAYDIVALGEQPVHQVAGNESGRAGDKDFHDWARRYSPRERRMRKISATLRRFPLNSCSRLSPSSRQRIGTSLMR